MWISRIGAAALGVVVTVSPAAAETLADALATAYRNSGLIDQNRAVLRAADEEVATAISLLRPAIDYAVGYSFVTPETTGNKLTGAAAIIGSMMLHDFGRSQIGVDAAKELVLGTRAALVDAENTVLLDTVIAYLSVRRSQAFVELRENNVRLLGEQLRATQDRFEVGEVTRTDVSLAEARLAAARSGLAAEEGGLERAREQYRTVVGAYPGNLAPPPPPPPVPASEDAARDVARQTNPQMVQVRHQAKAAELFVEQARRQVLPTLDATGRFQVDDNGNERTSLSIELSGPIYRGGAVASDLRQAQAQNDRVRAQLHISGLAVDQQVGNAYANLAVAVASIAASDQQVKAAQLALEGVREELQLGARTTLEVLDQEQEVLDAQTTRVAAETDRHVAVYAILDAMGLMTAEHLGLDVPVYDPAAYYNAVKGAPTNLVSPQGQKLDHVMRALGRK